MPLTSIISKPVILCLKADKQKLDLGRIKEAHPSAELICASSPPEGLEIIKSQPVALVIVDPNMKTMDGVDFLNSVREISPDTAKVLINCSHDPQLIVRAINQGKVWKCLTMPWKTGEIDRVIEEGLLHWKIKQKKKERPAIDRPDFYLQLVKKITDLLNKSEELNVILNETARIISSSLHYDDVSVFIWNEQKKQLVLRSSTGLVFDPEHAVRLYPRDGITGFVYQTRRPVIAMPASQHPQYKYIPDIGEEDMESYIGVPILLGNRCLGVLVAQRKEKKMISPAEEMMFQLITSRLAGMLDLASRIERIKKRKHVKHAARVYHGKGISPGYATGPVYLLQGLFAEVSVDHLEPTSAKNEISRLKSAFSNVENEQRVLIEELTSRGELPESEINIFKSHLMIVQDTTVLKNISELIYKQNLTAEQAVVGGFESFAGHFENQPNRYFQERAKDFRDIGESILKYLLESRGEWSESKRSLEGAVIVARDINPSQLPALTDEKAAAIVTEIGGVTSHTAILAKSLGIPAVSGVENICEVVNRGQTLLVDGRTGMVFVNPDKSLSQEYERNVKKQTRLQKAIEKKGLHSDQGGMPVKLDANIGFPIDVDFAVKYKMKDVGLYRTEFHFMQYDKWPSILEQFRTYEQVAAKFSGQITIRTLDVGADKFLPYLKFPQEDNPMLGMRSIRFSMEYLDFFKDQIKAILLGVHRGCRFRILLPMVSQLWELETANEIIVQLGEELGISKETMPPLGIMMEVPAVLHQLEDFKQFIQFISVGTNDLIQYTLAVDRNSNIVGHLYSEFHPAVIRVLNEINLRGKSLGLEVSVCGEMAGSLSGALALVSLGCSNLSILPTRFPALRFLISKLSPEKAEEVRKTILIAPRKKDIESYLNEVLSAIDPQLLETD